jgi:hypothetical protein
MAQQNIMMYKNFDASALSCGFVSKNRAGGNQVPLLYDGKMGGILLQTPVVAAPFGLSEYVPDNGSEPKYSIDVSFKGHDDGNSKINAFLNTIQNIDNHMISMGVANSQEWFGKTMSRAVVEELYRPLVKASKQPDKYAPTLKCKIRSIDKISSFTKNREVFHITDLQPGSTVKMILEFAPIWFVNKQFGVTLSILQLEMNTPPVGKLTGFSFVDDEEEY